MGMGAASMHGIQCVDLCSVHMEFVCSHACTMYQSTVHVYMYMYVSACVCVCVWLCVYAPDDVSCMSKVADDVARSSAPQKRRAWSPEYVLGLGQLIDNQRKRNILRLCDITCSPILMA